jgi:hypothetical protein
MNQEFEFAKNNFYGNHFPIDVAETGASAALVSDPPRAMNSLSDLSPLFTPLRAGQEIQDTLTPLRKLAPTYRQLMPRRPV